MPRSWTLLLLLASLPVFAPAQGRSTADQVTIQHALDRLNDPKASEHDRAAACDGLRELGAPARSVLWALHLAALDDPSPEVRRQARRAVVALGGERELADSLERRFAQVVRKDAAPELNARPARRAAAVAPPDAAIPPLVDDRPDPWLWETAFSLPGAVRVHAPRLAGAALAGARDAAGVPAQVVRAVESNIAALSRGTAEERRDAAERLGRCRAIAGPALPALVRALKDEVPAVRDAAARAIGTAGAARVADRGRWVEALSDPSLPARLAAALALLHDDFAPPDVMDAIVVAVAQADPLARQGLADAAVAAWHNDTAIAAALTRAAANARDPIDRQVNSAARKVLAGGARFDGRTLAPEHGAIIDELKRRLGSENPGTARDALRRLREAAPSLNLEGLLTPATLSDDPALRHDATEALIATDPPGVRPLIAMLKDPRREVKGLALVQIGRLGAAGARAAADIVPLLADPEDPDLRLMAADALGAIGPAAGARAAAALESARADSDSGVTAAATLAAARVNGEARVDRPPTYEHPTSDELNSIERQLRDADRSTRQLGAARLAERRWVAPPIARALGKAIDDGDYATREGLTIVIVGALRNQWHVRHATRELLERETDPARRACLRAAQRVIALVD